VFTLFTLIATDISNLSFIHFVGVTLKVVITTELNDNNYLMYM